MANLANLATIWQESETHFSIPQVAIKGRSQQVQRQQVASPYGTRGGRGSRGWGLSHGRGAATMTSQSQIEKQNLSAVRSRQISSFDRSSVVSGTALSRFKSDFGSGGGNFSAKGSDRESDAVAIFRILLSPIHSTEGKREAKSGLRSFIVEGVPLEVSFQDVHAGADPIFDSTRRLDIVSRLVRRLLSYRQSFQRPEVEAFRFTGSHSPV
jgi:hypothetical protein